MEQRILEGFSSPHGWARHLPQATFPPATRPQWWPWGSPDPYHGCFWGLPSPAGETEAERGGGAMGLGSAAAREQTLSPGCLFPKRGSLFVSLISGFSFPMHMHAPVGPGKAPLENQPCGRGAGANPTAWGNTSRFPASGHGFCCSPKTPGRAPSRALGWPQPRRAAGRRWRHGWGVTVCLFGGVLGGCVHPGEAGTLRGWGRGAVGCAQGGQELGLHPAGLKHPINLGESH